MFCENCGHQISDTAKFCSACGHPVGTAPSPGTVAPPAVPAKRESPRHHTNVRNTPETVAAPYANP